jgi:hypothetical protein
MSNPRPNKRKILTKIKVHRCIHTSLYNSLHFIQMLKSFMEKWIVKMLQPYEKEAKEVLKE